MTAYGLAYAVAWRMDIKFAWAPWQALEVLGAALLLPLCVGSAVNWKAYQGDVMENLRREA